MMKIHASGSRGGRMVSNPRTPTSVQGRAYASGMRSLLGTAGRGRGRTAAYVRPRRGRAG